MHNIIAKPFFKRAEGVLRYGIQCLKCNKGRIGYYACVALVLTAVAFAAEHYRVDGWRNYEELVLPAAELRIPAHEAVPTFELAEGMERIQSYFLEPAWHRLHSQWENHTAVDYACPSGKVLSLSDGVVATIGCSGVHGGFVEVETGEYLLRYASVNPSKKLYPGMVVQKGDEIGVADKSKAGEAFMEAHLHLELSKNNKPLDFEALQGKNLSLAD